MVSDGCGSNRQEMQRHFEFRYITDDAVIIMDLKAAPVGIEPRSNDLNINLGVVESMLDPIMARSIQGLCSELMSRNFKLTNFEQELSWEFLEELPHGCRFIMDGAEWHVIDANGDELDILEMMSVQ